MVSEGVSRCGGVGSAPFLRHQGGFKPVCPAHETSVIHSFLFCDGHECRRQGKLALWLPGADNHLQSYAFLHYFLPFIELNVMNWGINCNMTEWRRGVKRQERRGINVPVPGCRRQMPALSASGLRHAQTGSAPVSRQTGNPLKTKRNPCSL